MTTKNSFHLTPSLTHQRPHWLVIDRVRTMLFRRRLLLLWPVVVLLSAETAAYVTKKPDWLDAETTLLSFPKAPSPSLSAEQVARGCLRSLQLVDYPHDTAGIDRIFPFLSWEARGAITLLRESTSSIEVFRQRALLSPVLQILMGATSIELGEATLSPGTSTRGDIVSFGISVHGADVLAFQHKSGMIRDRVGSGPPETKLVIRLERQRRPPTTGCWLVRDIADVRFANGGQGWSRHEGV